jgi:hypothetical protein
MGKRKLWLLLLFVLGCVYNSNGQGLRINGDTIYVTEKIRPILLFAGDVEHDLSAGEETFEIQNSGNTIIISASAAAKKRGSGDIGAILLKEGEKKKKNQYLFYLAYRPSGNYKPYYDFDSDEDIQAHIADMERRKNSVTTTTRSNTGGSTGSNSSIASTGNSSDDSKPYGPDEYSEEPELDIEITHDELMKRVSNLIKRFNNYREQIVFDRKNAQKYCDRITTEIFNGCENCIIRTISRKGAAPVERSLKNYLNSLRQKPTNVSIELTAEKIQMVGKPVFNKERGKYYAYFEILQSYKSYTTNELRAKYEDLTRVGTQVEIAVYDEMDAKGNTSRKFQIYLTEVKAEEIL